MQRGFIGARRIMMPALRPIAATGCALLLAGCVGFSPDGGMSVVANIAGGELRKDVIAVRTEADASEVRSRIEQLLKRPLSANAAVQIALLNNRGLQAAYNELGIAEAARVAASLPPNPTFSLSRLAGPIEIEIERKILADILSLATLPARAEIATDRYRQAQLRAAQETVRVATEARRAWHRAVAARQLAAFLEQAQSAAQATAQLANRLGETGALNKLDQARDQVFYAEIAAQLATARQRAGSERERLIRAAGLWGGDLAFRLPDRQPTLPRRPLTLAAVEQEALRRRIDVQIARIDLEVLAKSYGLTNATRFVNLIELSGISKTTRERDPDAPVKRDAGIEIEFQIPLFDFGEVRVRQAEQTYQQAVNRLAEKAVNVRSEARDAYRAYRSSYDIVGHYAREILPLRKIISDETLLRYNAMQIDVFDLLAEARQRIASTIAAIEAEREFWLAATELDAALIGGGAPAGESSSTSTTVADSGGGAAH
jgi:outer membrane protein TolC